ncbi:arylsulfatase [Isosphaeraceae bacterium EP7]
MQYRRLTPLLVSALLACLTLMGAIAAEKAPRKPPNIVVFLADDMGFSDVGCYGGEIATPNLDALAAGGVRFSQFYNTARCWPSRASLLTGYYAQQVNRDPMANRPKWAALLPQLLQPAGYRSYQTGKWHVDGPVLAGGFSRSYELLDHNRNFNPRQHNLDDTPLPPVPPGTDYYTTTAVAGHALEFLDEHETKHKADPFFLYVAFTTPHFPVQAPEADIARYRGKYSDGWDSARERRLKRMRELGIYDGTLSTRDPLTIPPGNKPNALTAKIGPGEVGHAVAWDTLSDEQKAFQAEKMAIHAAMVDRMDREIGRVLDRLKAQGHEEDTIVLFASDNGASAEELIRGDGHDPAAPAGSAGSFLCLGPGWSTASNAPFRLHKMWNHEGGISTPLIVRWPAGIPARGEIRRSPGHLVDFAPTFLDLAGLKAPKTWSGEPRPEFPGKSLVPSLVDNTPIERDFLFFKHAGNRALRAGNWKIVAAGPNSPWELYNLAVDRGETTNLAAAHRNQVQQMSDTWAKADLQYTAQGATGGSTPVKARTAPDR